MDRFIDFHNLAAAAKLPSIKVVGAIGGATSKLHGWQAAYALTDRAAEAWASLQPNELACMLSHLLPWKQIRDKKLSGIHVIFEDDADLREDFMAKLTECLPTLPEYFDYAYLDHNQLLGDYLDRPGRFWLKPKNTTQKDVVLYCIAR